MRATVLLRGVWGPGDRPPAPRVSAEECRFPHSKGARRARVPCGPCPVAGRSDRSTPCRTGSRFVRDTRVTGRHPCQTQRRHPASPHACWSCCRQSAPVTKPRVNRARFHGVDFATERTTQCVLRSRSLNVRFGGITSSSTFAGNYLHCVDSCLPSNQESPPFRELSGPTDKQSTVFVAGSGAERPLRPNKRLSRHPGLGHCQHNPARHTAWPRVASTQCCRMRYDPTRHSVHWKRALPLAVSDRR